MLAAAVLLLLMPPFDAQQPSAGAGPVIVLETEKGTIEFETYPEEAPKTVAHIVGLVGRGFYDGQRFHRAEVNFLIQVGDPQSRDLLRQDLWGRAASGTPIGVAEITKKRTHVRGAVAMAYAGTDARTADSQFYVLLQDRPALNARYTVFGRVISGMDVVDRIRRADVLRKAYVRK